MGEIMDKVNEIGSSFSHGITIAERKSIIVSGVKKIESFDNEEFLMETTLGYLVIKGNVSIKGHVDSLGYFETSSLKKEKENSFLTRLFK